MVYAKSVSVVDAYLDRSKQLDSLLSTLIGKMKAAKPEGNRQPD